MGGTWATIALQLVNCWLDIEFWTRILGLSIIGLPWKKMKRRRIHLKSIELHSSIVIVIRRHGNKLSIPHWTAIFLSRSGSVYRSLDFHASQQKHYTESSSQFKVLHNSLLILVRPPLSVPRCLVLLHHPTHPSVRLPFLTNDDDDGLGNGFCSGIRSFNPRGICFRIIDNLEIIHDSVYVGALGNRIHAFECKMESILRRLKTGAMFSFLLLVFVSFHPRGYRHRFMFHLFEIPSLTVDFFSHHHSAALEPLRPPCANGVYLAFAWNIFKY